MTAFTARLPEGLSINLKICSTDPSSHTCYVKEMNRNAVEPTGLWHRHVVQPITRIPCSEGGAGQVCSAHFYRTGKTGGHLSRRENGILAIPYKTLANILNNPSIREPAHCL